MHSRPHFANILELCLLAAARGPFNEASILMPQMTLTYIRGTHELRLMLCRKGITEEQSHIAFDNHVSSSCEYCVDDSDALEWHAKWSIKTTPKASPSKLMAVRHRSNSQSRANMTAKSAAKRSSDTACIALARLTAEC